MDKRVNVMLKDIRELGRNEGMGRSVNEGLKTQKAQQRSVFENF